MHGCPHVLLTLCEYIYPLVQCNIRAATRGKLLLIQVVAICFDIFSNISHLLHFYLSQMLYPTSYPTRRPFQTGYVACELVEAFMSGKKGRWQNIGISCQSNDFCFHQSVVWCFIKFFTMPSSMQQHVRHVSSCSSISHQALHYMTKHERWLPYCSVRPFAMHCSSSVVFLTWFLAFYNIIMESCTIKHCHNMHNENHD